MPHWFSEGMNEEVSADKEPYPVTFHPDELETPGPAQLLGAERPGCNGVEALHES